MKKQRAEITSTGIKKLLQKFNPEKAIAEYIWNGFDAGATEVKVEFDKNNDELETYQKVWISDNGVGIPYNTLSESFYRFYESHKAKTNNNSNSLIMGKNGYGRFTFYKFADNATWHTVFSNGRDTFAYSITIDSSNLRDYSSTEPKQTTDSVGTKVEFKNISLDLSPQFIEKVLRPYLRAEFAWYLELKEEHKIFINGKELEYSSIIEDTESFKLSLSKEEDEIDFTCSFIRWNKKLNDEYSRFYFLNQNLNLKYVKTTSLNNKGDDFWHSVIIESEFFDNVNNLNGDDTQLKIFGSSDDKKVFKELETKLNFFLKEKRKPFLKDQADQLIEKYAEENVFPEFGNNEWDKNRKNTLESLVKEMYEVEPSLFLRLNKEQKRIFLELLNLVMDSDERGSLFKILDSVIDLDSDDRDEFAKILDTTKLKHVISTINLISNRLLLLENLKKIVFEDELKANERDHLQKFIDNHYWVFGEEYRLVCSEEVKFEKALNKYIYLLRGVNEKTYIEHPDKYREMDLFLTGTDFRDGKPHNVVVEIKNPTTIKKLKSKEVTQIKEYINVILSTEEFNDHNEYWSFYLIGQDYDDIVKDDIQDLEKGILRKHDNYCLYVKKWSEVVNDVERRLKYLLDKLKLQRKSLSVTQNIKEVMSEVQTTS